MSAGGAFAPVRMWMATALNAPKAVIDALERFIADKSVSFREMADLPGHTVIGRDSASAGIPEAVTITGGLEFTGTGSIQRSALTSDVTAPAGSGVTTIAPHAVTNGKFRQSAGLSVVGNATNATADVADIAAASDGQVLRRSGTGIAFGAVNLASANAITGNLPVANLNSGTGASSTTFWRGDGTWAPAGAGTVTSVASADGSITVTNPSTTVDLAVVKAPKWTTARTVAMSGDVVWSVSLDGSANVTAGGTIQAGAVTESKIGLSNVTTNNVSTSAHGFAPILPNVATRYLDGTGNYTVPAGSTGGSAYSAPAIASFTWVNQGASTATQTVSGGSILMNFACVAGLNWRGLFVNQPATPYKLVVQSRAFYANQSSQASGIYFYDGTKLLGIEVLYNAGNSVTLRVERINNTTTDNTTVYSSSYLFVEGNHGSPIWWQLRNSGTTLFVDLSADGVNFINIYSEAVGAFLTPTQIGWGGGSATTTLPLYHYLLNWTTVANANLDG